MQLLRRRPLASGARFRGRSWGRWALIAGVLVALLVGGSAEAKRRRRHHPRAKPAQPAEPATSAAPTAPATPAEIDPVRGCRSNPAVVGRCFELPGRSFRASGQPRLRIQPARSRKVLGVVPADAEIVPVCLLDLLQPGVEVRGRFLVCPLSAPARGRMPLVCVQAAREMEASRWDPATQQRIPVASAPACALEAPGPVDASGPSTGAGEGRGEGRDR